MKIQDLAKALNTGVCPPGLKLSPNRETDNHLLNCVLQGMELANDGINETGNILCEYMQPIVEPEYDSPFMTDSGLRFAEMVLLGTAYENYMVGANPQNPFPLINNAVHMAADLTISALSSEYCRGLGPRVAPEFEDDYRQRALFIDEQVHMARTFFTQDESERQPVVQQRQANLQAVFDRRSEAATGSLTSCGGFNMTGITPGTRLVIPKEDPVDIDDMDKNFFPDVQTYADEQAQAEQRRLEAASTRVSRREQVANNTKISKDDVVDTVRFREIPQIEDIVKGMRESWGCDDPEPEPQEETFDEDDEFGNFDGYGPIVSVTEFEDPTNAHIESIPRPTVTKAEAQIEKEKCAMYNQQNQQPIAPRPVCISKYDNGMQPQRPAQRVTQPAYAAGSRQAIPTHQTIGGQNMYQSQPQQNQQVQVLDLNNMPICDMNRRPLILPASMAPLMPVMHGQNPDGSLAFYNDGAPVIVFEHGQGNWIEWTPQLQAELVQQQQAQPVYGQPQQPAYGQQPKYGPAAQQNYNQQPQQQTAAQRMVVQKTPFNNDRPKPKNSIQQDYVNRVRQQRAERIAREQAEMGNAPVIEHQNVITEVAQKAEPAAPVAKTHQGWFDGEIEVRLHNGSVVKAVLREEALFAAKSHNSFGENLGEMGENYEVLITMVGNEAFEILVDKEKLVKREDHIRNNRRADPITLSEEEGTPKELAVREEKVETRPFTVECNGDSIIDAICLEDAMTVALRGSQDKGGIMMYHFETEEYPMSNPMPKPLMEKYLRLRNSGEHKQMDVVFDLLSSLKDTSVPGINYYMNTLLAEWCQNTIRFRLDKKFPTVTTTHFMDDFKPMCQFLAEEGVFEQFLELLNNEIPNFIKLAMDANDGLNDDVETCTVKNMVSGYIVTLSEEDKLIQTGRVDFAKNPSLYRTLDGAYRAKAKAGDKSDWIYVASAAGQWLRVMRAGTESCPMFFVTSTMPA